MLVGHDWRPELSLLRLTIVPEVAGESYRSTARAIHAAVLKLVEKHDWVLTRLIHDAPVNPITIWPEESFAQNPREPSPSHENWIIGLLDRRVVRSFTDGLIASAIRGDLIDLDWHRYRVAAVTCASPTTTYVELHDRAPTPAELSLRFASPVMFLHKGDVPRIPEPRLVFGSYLRRWNTLSALPLELNEFSIEAQIELVDSHLVRSENILFGRAFPAFVGIVTYRIDGEEPLRKEVATLASFANYCGTGAKTAIGMGRTISIV